MYNHRRKNGRVRVYYTSKGERRESYSKPEDCYACSKHILTRQTYKAACSGHHISFSFKKHRSRMYPQNVFLRPKQSGRISGTVQSDFRIAKSKPFTRTAQPDYQAEHRTKDVDALIRKIYEDNIAGRLSDKMLENLLEGYEKEKMNWKKNKKTVSNS